ncbi:MAG: AAA family ATPase, partial [Anaerobacillus sp.]
MKPIRLSVSGLHSFREKQEIDFETLCQGGIFGIFGPTGSGKSSLLDAMTLALYGKVERAANNTQGIMNHAEDTLSVSFTFELGAHLRYRVERSYKRSGDISIRSANSRLIEIGEENTVLADKDRDVSQKIQEILGLTIDDFTRAVVLPQGKFAEFLSLKGTERRQMLQRLFQLEKYGDQFNRRLRARVDEQKSFLNEVIAEQTGLGEASKQNLKEAKTALQKADTAAEVARENLVKAEKRKEEATEIWELTQQMAELHKKKDVLNNKSGEIEGLQTKINEATAASQLKPYLDAVEATEEEEIKAEERYKETKRQLKEANAIYLSKLEAYEKHRSIQQEQEPLLIKRLNELERGMGLEKELSKLRSEWNSLEKQRITLEKETRSAEEETEKAHHDLKVARSLQTDLNQQLTELQVAPADRKRMAKALSLKQEFQSLTKQLEETSEEEKKSAAERDRLRPYQVETTRKLNQSKENYSAYYQSVQSTYHLVSSYKLTLEQHMVKLKDQIVDANKKL